MPSHSLHWAEGLFLRPHHFQAQERLLQEAAARTVNWLHPFPWGLHDIEVDTDALSNWRISLAKCHVRLKDGTLVRFPEDCHVSPETIPRALFRTADTRIRVSLAVPELRRGPANVTSPTATTVTSSAPVRYVPHEEETEDENAAGNPQNIEFRRLNPRILLGDDTLRGYDSIPIFQLRLGSTPEAPPHIDPDYFPPLLRLEAWSPAAAFIRSIYDYLSGQSTKLTPKVLDLGTSISTVNRDDLEIVLRLNALNSALGCIAPLPFLPNVHPLTAFTELARAAGFLAYFRRERQLAQLPAYLHDDIALTFRELRKLIEVSEETKANYERADFSWQGLQLTARIKQTWLEPGWGYFIGVESPLSTTRVVELLSEKELSLKVGSTEEVDAIYSNGRAGIQVTPVTDIQIPRALPRHNWHYFRIQRDERNSTAWGRLERSLNLGVRVNERKIQKNPDAQNRFDVKDTDSGNLASLAFSLFAIRTG